MKMRNVDTDMEIDVEAHAILQNGWEYYFVAGHAPGPIRLALVWGFELELGDVDLEEIRPYLMTFTMDLDGVMPAPGWEWVTSPDVVTT